MKIVSWNCRGIGNSRFRRFVQDMCRVHRPDFLCLLETRSNSSSVMDIPNLLHFQNNFRVHSDGFSGSLWVMWNNVGFQATVIGSSSQAIHMCVSDRDKEPWVLSFCYVRPHSDSKSQFWRDMEIFS